MEKLQLSINNDACYVDELLSYSNSVVDILKSSTFSQDELEELKSTLIALLRDNQKFDSIVEPDCIGEATRVVNHLLSIVESMIYRYK